MAGRRVEYKASVESDLRRIDAAAALRILRKVEKTLTAEGHEGEALSAEFAGLYRFRVGDDRVIYAGTEPGFLVLRIAHRKDVYRKGRP